MRGEKSFRCQMGRVASAIRSSFVFLFLFYYRKIICQFYAFVAVTLAHMRNIDKNYYYYLWAQIGMRDKIVGTAKCVVPIYEYNMFTVQVHR